MLGSGFHPWSELDPTCHNQVDMLLLNIPCCSEDRGSHGNAAPTAGTAKLKRKKYIYIPRKARNLMYLLVSIPLKRKWDLYMDCKGERGFSHQSQRWISSLWGSWNHCRHALCTNCIQFNSTDIIKHPLRLLCGRTQPEGRARSRVEKQTHLASVTGTWGACKTTKWVRLSAWHRYRKNFVGW